MKKQKTHRGFDYYESTDLYDKQFSLQKSSLATDDAIWFGIDDAEPKILIKNKGWVKYDIPENVSLNTRMHLNKEQVKELLPILQKFADSGNI